MYVNKYKTGFIRYLALAVSFVYFTFSLTSTYALAPHDNISYLSSLARLLGEELDHVCSAVEMQYTCAAFTQPGWFEAERADKAALILAELAAAVEAAASLPVLVAGLDAATLRPSPPEPLARALAAIGGTFAALLEQYEQGQRPLAVAKALVAALARCEVACRRLEPKGPRFVHEELREPVPLSSTMRQLHVHLMLMVGQYELSPARAVAHA